MKPFDLAKLKPLVSQAIPTILPNLPPLSPEAVPEEHASRSLSQSSPKFIVTMGSKPIPLRAQYSASIILVFNKEEPGLPNHYRFNFIKNRYEEGFEQSVHYANLKAVINGRVEYHAPITVYGETQGWIVVDFPGYLDLKTQFP